MMRRAKISEIPEILALTKACSTFMAEQGIFQWNAHYPSLKDFETDLFRNELYIIEENDSLLGTITISTKMDSEYASITWLTPNSRHIYIHRLAVHPSQQGKGYGVKMMDFAEDYARKRGVVSLRLDTFSRNKRNQKFYEQRGYCKLGDVFFPAQSEFPFYCYELVL